MNDLVTPRPDFTRNGRQQPLITPENGGKPVPYTRCTTFVSAIEDGFGIATWKRRLAVTGLIRNAHLREAAERCLDHPRALDSVCEDAFEAAGGSHKANVGTALHELTERVDRGELVAAPYPTVLDGYAVDAILDAYREATASLKCVAIEERVVLDGLKIAGTADRVVEYDGERYIADIKTGSIDLGTLKIAAQLAVYARAVVYNPTTAERSYHGASAGRGIIIHLPAVTDPADAVCTLWWVDLETGWDAVLLSRSVREKRALRFAALTEAFGDPVRPSLRLEKRDADRAAEQAAGERDRIVSLIRNSPTADDVRAVWASNEAVWDDALTEIAREVIAGLPASA
jgi:predicted RecB family endonuclease